MKRLTIKMILILGLVLITACEKKESGLPIDGDGNEYDTIRIGSQTWLKQNLKTTKYNNGVSIPYVTSNSDWASKTSAAYCWYNNNSKNKDNYGALYNYYVVRAGTLCPEGYHVPTDSEWIILKDNLSQSSGGAQLKDNSLNLWQHSTCANNQSGFDAVPSGVRNIDDGNFYSLGIVTWWWSSSIGTFEWSSFTYGVWDDDCVFYRTSSNHKFGFSVRCIKNN